MLTFQMHDNDSSTGLLVQNKKGDQWIAYGKINYSLTKVCYLLTFPRRQTVR